uniref:Uncharacterized protein n=1 Tax=Anopheles farauti TaxID=69004 RepID=A0A182R0X7_9DIPT
MQEEGVAKGPTAKSECSKKRRRPKARLSVIKVSAVGEVGTKTYVEMLTGMQEDPALSGVGSNIVRTRRAGEGALLLNVKKDADVRELLAPLRSKLGGKATVTAMEPMVTVECRDLDQDATPDQVARAMLKQHQVDVSSSAVRFRRGRDLGTTVAVFQVPERCVDGIETSNRLRVGWSLGPSDSRRKSPKNPARAPPFPSSDAIFGTVCEPVFAVTFCPREFPFTEIRATIALKNRNET